MRLTQFSGLKPKLPSQHLEDGGASVAVNVDFHDNTAIRPWKSLKADGRLVDIDGAPYAGEPATIYYAGGVWVGFPEPTTICLDHRNRAGEGSFLFVRNGSLWRSSARWVVDKKGPVQVGIKHPDHAPSVAVSKDENPFPPKFPDATCGVQNPNGEDCNDLVPPEARIYLMTYVNCMGEESAPSPASMPVDVQLEDSVLLLDSGTPPANATHRRYYRSVVGSKGTVSMLFVAEQAIETLGFTDTRATMSLGDPIETAGHFAPPSCLEGVAVMGDNLTVVWSGRNFWVSEPMLPHAYSHREKWSVEYDIVRIVGAPTFSGAPVEFDTYVLTKGTPYHYSRPRGSLTGKDAERGSFGPWPFNVDEPCVGIEGVAAMDGGVAYCSPHGLIVLKGREVASLMDGVMTEREWQQYGPAFMSLAYHHGLLFGVSKIRSWVLPVSSYVKSRAPNLSHLSIRPSAAYADPQVGLHFALSTGGPRVSLFQWGTGEGNMKAIYRSKDYVMPGQWEPSAMKVVGDFPPETRYTREARRQLRIWERRHGAGTISAFLESFPQFADQEPALRSRNCPVIVRVYNSGELYYERRVYGPDPFRLPHRRYGIEWAVEVETSIQIREIQMETSMNDLVQLGMGVGNSV